MSNYLTNFSNGITHFTRTYPPLREATRISIPFKKNTLADALATLVVFGDVTITEPAGFPAVNQVEHAAVQPNVLTIDPANVNRELASKLSGARIEVMERGSNSTAKGTLIGIQPFSEPGTSGSITDRYKQTTRYKLVILDEDGVVRSFTDENIAGTRFLDEEIQVEIRKALARNFQSIKPDSAFVSIGLSPSVPGGTDAAFVIEYTIPTSAWQPVYQLRLKSGVCELEALAKVDNPTDEDWNDTILSVATGDPNTFETDLAMIRQPKRQRINIVSDQAIGAVNADEEVPAVAGRAYSMTLSNDTEVPRRVVGKYLTGAPHDMRRAQTVQAVTQDVGDFAIYTCEHPVSIGANRSAVIPLFRMKVEGSILLIYKESSDAERPFRAVRFKNTTANSLGKGSCTVYNEGTYQGQCILESSKPGEERILPHARENGVRVWKNPVGSSPQPYQSRRHRLAIDRGVFLTETVRSCEVVYRVRNNKAESFLLEIEHPRALFDSAVSVRGANAQFSSLQDGVRIPVDLPPHGDAEVRVSERQRLSESWTLKNNGSSWLLEHVLQGGDLPQELVSNPHLAAVFEAHRALLTVQQEIRDSEAESRTLQSEQTRKMELVKAGGSGSNVDGWLAELADNEKAIKTLERQTLPAQRKEEMAAQRRLDEAMQALSLTWNEVTPEE